MRKLVVLLLAGVLLLSVGLASAQDTAPGAVIENRFVTSTLLEGMNDIVLDFYPSPQFVQPRYPVDEYAVRFYTQYPDGTPAEIVAQMYVPVIPENVGAPVFVYGAGTTGLIDACAPSLEDVEVADWGNYRDYLRTYATQGYIVIMPDYAGFNDPDRLQPYYVAEMQGRVALDAARAVYNIFGGEPLGASGQAVPFDGVFIGGYSQGGTTVFGARDIHPDYAPDVPLLGILSYGSVTDQKNHMLTRPEFAAYRWVAWEEFYGPDEVDLSVIFADLYAPTVRNEATTLCVRQAFGFYPADPSQVYQPAFYEALANDTMAEDFPQHNALLEANSPGFTASDVKVMILQGDGDETIPVPKMAEFLTEYCALEGNEVTYVEYFNTTHFDTRQKAYIDTLDWMRTVVTGAEVRDDCGEFSG